MIKMSARNSILFICSFLILFGSNDVLTIYVRPAAGMRNIAFLTDRCSRVAQVVKTSSAVSTPHRLYMTPNADNEMSEQGPENNNSNDNNNSDDSGNSGKSTKFNRVLDDFIGKKFGAGEAFYGRRTSSLSEQEYQSLLSERGGTARMLVDDDYDESRAPPMKDNAILLVGDIAKNDVLQWVGLELCEKGFSVRLAVADRKDAIRVFGLPGNNVDIVELRLPSKGGGEKKVEAEDEEVERKFAAAIEGVQAIVLCCNFDPTIEAFQSKRSQSEIAYTEKIVTMATRARKAKVGDIQKVVCISRCCVPVSASLSSAPVISESESGNMSEGGDSKSGKSGPKSRNSSKKSWGKTRISAELRARNPLQALTQGIADSKIFASFQLQHAEMEDAVRCMGYDYMIVRAPPVVDLFGEGSTSEIVLLDGSFQRIISTGGVSNVDSPSAVSPSLSEAVVKRGGEKEPLKVSSLDLAEAAVQALLGDCSGLTFTVCNADQLLHQQQQQQQQQQRGRRDAYYGILSMGETDMKMSYVLKPAEQYRLQIEEDQRLEQYWSTLLDNLSSAERSG